MLSLRAGSRVLGWVAAGIVAGGLLVGSAWYATSNHLTDELLDSLTGRASAQEIASAAPPGPGATNSRRPTGEVTQITPDPAAFTLRTGDGVETTYRVLDTTVFMAGHDRPYRFDLLKQGDHVVVRGGVGKTAEDTQATAPTGAGKGKNKQARAASPDGMVDGEPVARQVMVRPAGEKVKKNGKQGPAAIQPASSTNGGSDATRQ